MKKYQLRKATVVPKRTSVFKSNKMKQLIINDPQLITSSSAHSSFVSFENPSKLETSRTRDVQNDGKKIFSNAWLILAGLWHVFITLAVLLISIYLLEYKTTTATTTTTTTTSTDQSPTPLNQTNSSTVSTTTSTVSTTVIQEYYCTGISPYTSWQVYGTAGITMPIDTSSCKFNTTPSYFTSIYGTDNHWNLGGYQAIYSPTTNSFTIYAQTLNILSLNNSQLFGYSQTYQWSVHWLGISK